MYREVGVLCDIGEAEEGDSLQVTLDHDSFAPNMRKRASRRVRPWDLCDTWSIAIQTKHPGVSVTTTSFSAWVVMRRVCDEDDSGVVCSLMFCIRRFEEGRLGVVDALVRNGILCCV